MISLRNTFRAQCARNTTSFWEGGGSQKPDPVSWVTRKATRVSSTFVENKAMSAKLSCEDEIRFRGFFFVHKEGKSRKRIRNMGFVFVLVLHKQGLKEGESPERKRKWVSFSFSFIIRNDRSRKCSKTYEKGNFAKKCTAASSCTSWLAVRGPHT